MVAIELILEAVDATIAATSAANTSPRCPAGSSRIIVGYASSGLRDRRQHHGRDARQHDDHRHQQLQERREDDALLRLVDALGRQRALDDVLIEAPVADVRDPHAADQHGEARQVFVVRMLGDRIMWKWSGTRAVSASKPATTPAPPPTLSSVRYVITRPPSTSSVTCTMSVSATAFSPPYSW